MRDDLLHAQASVDWAVSQLPAFKERLDGWIDNNINVIIRDHPSSTEYDNVVAVYKCPFPLEFHVEAGAYINAIRSSLDILAATLANRHCQNLIDQAYFPIAKTRELFVNGQYKGREFLQALPDRERSIIEALEPYGSGNAILYGLHNLDIVRKHARLLNVSIQPERLSVTGIKMRDFRPDMIEWRQSGNEETTLGLITKRIPQPKFKLTPLVSFNEAQYLQHRDIIATLREFASVANSIINRFDFS
jgi:hypothetical protein